jgi:hypothetical protein
LGYYTGKGLTWKWSEPLGRRRTEWGGVRVQKQAVRVPAYIEADRRMCEGDRTSRGGQGMVEVKLLCFRWLSPFLKLTQKKAYNIQDKAKV